MRTIQEQESRFGMMCSISSHTPTPEGSECLCGYFAQAGVVPSRGSLNDKVRNVLIEMTEFTGFDHSDKSVAAFKNAVRDIGDILWEEVKIYMPSTYEDENTRS